MIKAIFRLIALCVLLTSVPVKADVSQYTTFTDAAGNIYLKAPENFVLIHAEVSIPLLVSPKNGLLKLSLVNGSWVVQELTLSQWNALNLTPSNASVDQLRFGDIDGDGVLDIVMSLNSAHFPALSLTNLKGNAVVRALNTGGYLSPAFVLQDVNSDGIMDIVDNDTVLLGQRNGVMLYTGRSESLSEGNHVGLTSGVFRVDESGQVSYQIPLVLPAGVAGVQPQVSLTYSSGSGQGIAGMGWNVSSTSIISRCPKTVIQDNVNQMPKLEVNDGFCLNGQRLKLISGVYGKAESKYRLELDDFSRITAVGQDLNGSGPQGFEVRNKAGETHYYGNTSFSSSDADAFVEPGGFTAGSVASFWALKGYKDDFNNKVEFSYLKNGVTGTETGAFLINSINYSGGAVNFKYETIKEPQQGYSYGGVALRKYRLDAVEVEQSGEDFRYYDLSYVDSADNYLNAVQECLTSSKSSCKNATTFDYHKRAASFTVASAGTLAAPASTNFIDLDGDGITDQMYVSADGKTLSVNSSAAGLQVITSSLQEADAYSLFDVNGDSVADIVYAVSGTWNIAMYAPKTSSYESCEQLGNGSVRCDDIPFTEAYQHQSTIFTYDTNVNSVNNQKPFFADIDGDGLLDWVRFESRTIKTYLNKKGSFNTTDVLSTTLDSKYWDGQKDWSMLYPKSGDINGDGNTDLLLQFKSLVCQEQGSGGIWIRCTNHLIQHRGLLNKGNNNFEVFSLYSDKSKLIDLNSDNLADFVFKSGSTWKYQLSKGGTNVNLGPVTSLVLSNLSTDTSLAHLETWQDLNQDGSTDFIAPVKVGTSTKLGIYWGTRGTDGSWGLSASPDTVTLSNLGTVNSQSLLRLADRNSDGDQDLYFANASGTGNQTWTVYANLLMNTQTDATKIPLHAMKSVTNGYGVATEIQYKPMTDSTVYKYLPAFDTTGTLDPDYLSVKHGMWLVSSVASDSLEQSGAVSKLVVDYMYEGLRLHKKGYGSAGFKRLTTTDKQSNIVTTTEYEQSWPFTGRPLSTEVKLNDQVLSKATSVWSSSATADNGVFVYLSASEEIASQQGTDGVLRQISHVKTTNKYDENYVLADKWGNLTSSEIKYYGSNQQLFLTTSTQNTYDGWTSLNSKRYGRLSRSVVTNTQPAITGVQPASTISRRSDFTYNVDHGLLESETIGQECTAATATTLSTRATDGSYCDLSNQYSKSYLYNTKGLVTEVTTGGRKELTSYSDDGRFILSKTNTAGHAEEYLYNGAKSPAGLIYSVTTTGPNDIASTTHFNDWGEAYKVSSADGTTQLTELFGCSAGAERSTFCSAGDIFYSKSVKDGSPTTVSVTDKFGRNSAQFITAFDGGYNVTYTSYDKFGRVDKQYLPRKTSNQSALFAQNSYDIFGRVTKRTEADASTVSIVYKGLVTSSQDENGFWRDEVKDVSGRVLKTTDPYASTAANPVAPTNTGYVQFTYSAFGDQLSQAVYVYENSAWKSVSTSHSYDKYGRKLFTSDPTKGKWYYGYNGLGEQVVQVNARNEVSRLEYNELGQLAAKLQQRSAAEGGGFDKTCYSYGNSPAQKNLGKLIQTAQYSIAADTTCSALAATTARYSETQTYDLYGRPASSEQKHSGKTFTQSTSYDGYGRINQQVLPLGRVITLGYQNGYQKGVYEFPGGALLSEVESMDAAGRVTKEKLYGNTSRTTAFDANRGFVDSISVSAGGRSVYNVSYDYDSKGTTELRTSQYHDKNGTGTMTVTEDFVYTTEGHSRLKDRVMTVTNAALGNNVSNLTQSFSYDALGNIKSKTGVGTYSYNATNPYKLATVSGGSKAYTMAYDAHGNITSDSQRTFSYSSADMPLKIAQGGTITEFAYGPDNQRFYRKDSRTENGVATTTETFYAGKVYEQHHKKTGSQTTPSIEHRWYIGPVVITNFENTGAEQYEVLHGDALGSTVAVTDGSGQLKAHYLYDAWGKQSQIMTGFVGTNPIAPAASRRAYTGHENVEGLDIIHMNGRIYDATLARFMQADPFVQAPTNSQSYNRYSYVLNNPLSYTDPSGYFFSGLKNLVKKYWKVVVAAVVVYVTAGAASGWVSTWGATWGTAATAATATTAATAATLTTAGSMAVGAMAGAAGGFIGGALQTGSLTGALRGSVTGAIAGGAGGYANFGNVSGWGDASARIGVAALGGCAAGEVSGGTCGKGARMAAMTQALTMGASELYRKVSTKTSKQTGNPYNEDGKPHFKQRGQSDVGSQLDDESYQAWERGTLKSEDIDMDYDKSRLMQKVGKGPYMDAFAEFHDGLHDYSFIPDDQVSLILTMPPSYAVTILAAAQPYSSYYHLRLNYRRAHE